MVRATANGPKTLQETRKCPRKARPGKQTTTKRSSTHRLRRDLLRASLVGTLATLDAETKAPYASMAAVAPDFDGAPVLLLSTLAVHTANLAADNRVSLLLDARTEDDGSCQSDDAAPRQPDGNAWRDGCGHSPRTLPAPSSGREILFRLQGFPSYGDRTWASLKCRFLAGRPDAAGHAGCC
ncbi:MAG: pyridoxamine 5'-phosphate oxidase family protein [Rhodobiaceae bacterium]|nr:pyridoxamine 5'-phosphate oxidase family protein [Rhodobiaceae bacterium]